MLLFHHHTHAAIYLSKQQGRCFLLLMKGKSAKEIGIEMQLSHRTVEHYLEKIRQVSGVTSSKELIALYSGQFIYQLHGICGVVA